MDITEIRNRVVKISDLQDDWEAAHSREDDLYLDVLKAIANGADNGQALAAEAIKAADLPFARYHA